ncbi:MAG: tRNA epoxyqueuosine(34) reductase QueG [Nitrospirae bacterium]|nr:tRNA epoxyqueuosine(34) reductase QueG [Nitrospirota bacterium]
MSPLPRSPLRDRIKARAQELGFDLVGIARADALTPEADRLRAWLEAGRQGQMTWLDRTAEKRGDPARVLPRARSIISLAMNYSHPDACTGAYHISKYAQGTDYHRVLGPKIDDLCAWLREQEPQSTSLGYVDTGPVLEKAWAQRAGLGWIGKHSNLINPEIGSWILLGAVLTTIDLDPDPPGEDACGHCTLCIDACPTGAIVEPYVVDSNRCISYLTIEHRGEIEAGLREKMGTHIFGCDICQDVCPWNTRAPRGRESAFSDAPMEWSDVALENLDEAGFSKIFRTSAVKRPKWEGFRRNLDIARRSLKAAG